MRTIIFTDISRDGTLSGTNIPAYERLVPIGADIVASGGIADIAELKKLKATGCAGAILGKAIYDGKIDLKQAIAAVQDAG